MAEAAGHWVEAAPFRAHLRHLMAVGSLTVADVAALVDVPVTAAERLLTGRQGRPVRRISPHVARRLYAVSAREVHNLRWCWGPAEEARHALIALRAGGWDDATIARRCLVGVPALEDLARGGRQCPRLLSLRLTAALRERDRQVDRARLRPSPAVVEALGRAA